MSSLLLNPMGQTTLAVAASGKVAVFSKGLVNIWQQVGYPNFPMTETLAGTVTNGALTVTITNASNVRIEAGNFPVLYDTGTDPVVQDVAQYQIYNTPGVLNATGALTAAMMTAGIVTSTTAAAVAGTVPTGTVMDAALLNMKINDSFDWSVIATGANAFTVTAASGHTLVGVAVVATVTSGHFRTVKTAAATYITYRVG